MYYIQFYSKIVKVLLFCNSEPIHRHVIVLLQNFYTSRVKSITIIQKHIQIDSKDVGNL